jgi:hypothetical protein
MFRPEAWIELMKPFRKDANTCSGTPGSCGGTGWRSVGLAGGVPIDIAVGGG